ncbi:DUF4249 domain-containing protein [Pedobacter sp.]
MGVVNKYPWFLILIFFIGCKEKFSPDLKENNQNLLVVEGLITLGSERTQIKLSRTVSLSQNVTSIPENGASVTIEDNANQIYSLAEKGLGVYESAVLNLISGKKYRVRIKSKGNEYVSDFTEAKLSPAIESINWEAKPNGVQIYLNTRDNTNSSRYYKWDFEETWIFNARYNSSLIWGANGLRLRNRDTEDIYRCWATGIASEIFLGSSVKLESDVINKQPLVFIPSTSEKFTDKYSILVKQSVLTKEAFEFWENLRRNTESLGTIFDALPSQLTGNIRNVKNPSEPVIGFISAGELKTKRIFISKSELPNWRVEQSEDCNVPDTIPVNRAASIFANGNYIAIEEVFSQSGALLGYTGTVRKCGDCTTRGTNRKPSFWP